MRIIVLNSSNLVQDGQNNKLVYKFPNSTLFKDNFIAVSSVNMYYSWFNITQALGNNTFSYTWTIGAVVNVRNITIPDGLYQISTLNDLLQYNMINNGDYLIETASGNYVYYAEFLLNATRYAVQINTYLVPIALPVGYTQPANFSGYPATVCNPIITLPAKFNDIMGYIAGFTTSNNIGNPAGIPATTQYVSKNDATGTISYISTKAPNLQPNSSIYFSMSNINNPYSIPSSIIYSLVATGDVGAIIQERPPQFMWNRLIDGTYNELLLTFLGQDFRPIQIQDPTMTILLTIRDKEDVGISK